MKNKYVLVCIIAVIAGCAIYIINMVNSSNYEMHAIKGEFEHQAGDTISTSASYYVVGSPKEVVSDAVVDASGVKVNEVGDYQLFVNYKNIVETIKIHVVDTKPVEIEILNSKGYVEVPINQQITIAYLEQDGQIKVKEASTYSYLFRNGKDTMEFDAHGSYNEQVQFVDKYGNESLVSISIKIIDKNEPEIKIPGPFVITKGQSINPRAGMSAYDKEDGDLTAQVEISDYDVNKVGEQTIRYSVSDSYGNKVTCSTTLTVNP